MNGTSLDLEQISKIAAVARKNQVQTVICLPATLLDRARDTGVLLGGQDCHVNGLGAHTGDISAAMLADCGATYVILGHSERRTAYDESNEIIHIKARTARAVGLNTIICIGETAKQRRKNETLDVLNAQIVGSVPPGATPDNTIIAYEPIWAIGTGLTPNIREIAMIHRSIRSKLNLDYGTDRFSLLYGGSISSQNAAGIFGIADVDGGLVGGASLTAADFTPVIRALSNVEEFS